VTTRVWRGAVLSDPHGDLVALTRVVSDMEVRGPFDEVLLGGDLAQGGPQPAETIDFIRAKGWASVRGNSDDLLIRLADGMSWEEAFGYGSHTHPPPRPEQVTRAQWSVEQLGPDRIAYLRSLPMFIRRGPYQFGSLVLVHATPWSTEDVILPDADEALGLRAVQEADAGLLLYGHIHTQYLRHVDDATLMSLGAVGGSNDGDPRPAYVIVTIGENVTVEPRRVEWPKEERVRAYDQARIDRSFVRADPGPLPVRCEANTPATIWPR